MLFSRAKNPTVTKTRTETEMTGWAEAPIRLKYVLGEVLLGSCCFQALVARSHFTELITGVGDPPPPFERLPPGVIAAKIPSCPISKALRRFSLFPNCFRYAPTSYRHLYIDLCGSFDQYIAKFSAKSRYTLRKKVRRFEVYSGGVIAWRAYKDKSTLGEFYRLAREVSRKTYQEKLLRAGIPDRAAFDREMTAAPSMRAYVLFHAEKPIAFLGCPERDGNLLYEHVGYDPAYRELSPGTVLMFLALKAIFDEGLYKTFDFTEGEGAHKELFANRHALCADVYFFRRSLRCAAMVGAHASFAWLSRWIVKGIDKVGAKSTLKNLLRHGLRRRFEGL